MKVLQINSVCGIGSTGRIATDIHAQLIKMGYDSYIAYGRGEIRNINAAKTIKIGNKFSQYLHIIKTRLFDKHGFGSKKATKKFIKEVELLNPDVIHLHNIHGYYINIEILFDYLKKTNKKVIWTLHDCWPFTGHSAYFTHPKVEGWQSNGIHNCGGRKRYPKSILADRRMKNGKDKVRIFSGVKDLTIVTPSKWLKDLVEESYLSQYDVKVIKNGIDLETFKPRESNFREKYNLESKRIILGVASVWEERKGLNYFFGLSEKLNEDEVIVLVGLKEKQLRKLPKNIIGITRTNNAIELAEIYTAADVFFNPTLEDNYPTVNLEAQACGTPVVTFNTGGSPESATVSRGYIANYDNYYEVLNKTIKDETVYKDFRISISEYNFIKEYIEIYIR